MKMNCSVLALVHGSKLMFVRFFIFALLLVPSLSYAQTTKIAVVDLEMILSQSLAGKSIQEQLKQRRAEFQKEFSAREDELMSAEKLLIEQKASLSNEEFALKRKEFETKLLETRNLFQKRRNALDKGVNKALSKLRQTVAEITAKISEEENYNVVLTKDSVVLVETEMDISEKVMRSMNNNLSTIPLEITL